MGFGHTVLFSLCLSCEFPPFHSFVSGVLEKLGRDSVEMVHGAATVTVVVQGRAGGPPALCPVRHWLLPGCPRNRKGGPSFWETEGLP